MRDEFGLDVVFTDGWGEAEHAAYSARLKEEWATRSFFVSALAPSYFHWHFQQAFEALQNEYYLPGVSGLLNGIEASLRTTLCEIGGKPLEGDLGSVMSNGLIRQARDAGMDISHFALPDEKDFYVNLETKSPVELVQIRNNVCHGNFQQFIRNEPDIGIFFTPECLRPIAARLLELSFNWAKSLSMFREGKNLMPVSTAELSIPKNPLARWLNS